MYSIYVRNNSRIKIMHVIQLATNRKLTATKTELLKSNPSVSGWTLLKIPSLRSEFLITGGVQKIVPDYSTPQSPPKSGINGEAMELSNNSPWMGPLILSTELTMCKSKFAWLTYNYIGHANFVCTPPVVCHKKKRVLLISVLY